VFKVTAALKAYLTQHHQLKANASDEEVKALATQLLLTKKLDVDKINELCKDGNDAVANMAQASADAATNAVKAVLEAYGIKPKEGGTGTGGTGTEGKTTETAVKLTPEEEAVKSVLAKLGVSMGDDGAKSATPTDFAGVMHKSANGASNVRVKNAYESYSNTKTALVFPNATKSGAKHFKAGQPATFHGEQLYSPSDLTKAVTAAYFKWSLASSSRPSDIPRGLRMTDHDKDLVNYAIHEMKWTGLLNATEDGGGIKVARRKLTEFEIKALLDDATSGGVEIAPIEFDDALVTTPVLYGEFFPMVEVYDVARGRRMKGGAVANPTFGSTQEGTAITAFDTTSFVSAFDTTIYAASAGMEIGLDFEEDSPTNVGSIIIDKFGEKAMEWLDRVIVAGNGTTEPQGITLASGITTINSDNGVSGPPTVSDYEGLMFGVTKAFRTNKGSRNVFFGNETSYRRARAIPVGPADERRVFGLTHGDYMLLDQPYKIQGSLTNSQIGYANLGYYRMYRRLGFNVRMETAGNYLATRNLRLIVVRMRYGGRMELGGAAALSSDSQQ